MRFIYIVLLMSVFGNYYQELIKTKSGLQYCILKKGNGKTARVGDEILLFETTSYRDGTVLYTNEVSVTRRFTNVWIKTELGWQLTARQSTRIIPQ